MTNGETATIKDAWPLMKERLTASSAHTFEEGGKRLGGSTKAAYNQDISISFLTVVKNRRASLERTIKSVLSQKSSRIEHIIVDGFSTDGTKELIRSYSSDLEYYVSRPDKSLYEAINIGIELCRGRYICILNSDDWLTPGSVSRILSDIDKHTSDTFSCILCYGAWKHIENQKLKLWIPRTPRLSDYFSCTDLCHNAMYIPRSAYQIVGPYDESYKIAADTKWILSAVEHSQIFKTIDYPTCFYSMNGISSNGHGHWADCLRMARERFPQLSDEETSSILSRFYRFSDNIPREYRQVVSDAHLNQIVGRHKLSSYVTNQTVEHSSKMRQVEKLILKFKKIVWRAKHKQTK